MTAKLLSVTASAFAASPMIADGLSTVFYTTRPAWFTTAPASSWRQRARQSPDGSVQDLAT
jgi:hypothetical protein